MILIKYISYLDASFVIIKENKRKNLIKCLCLMHLYSSPKEYINNSLFIYLLVFGVSNRTNVDFQNVDIIFYLT